MHKYADDTYLVVPASNSQSCAIEIDNVEKWAEENNLLLNRTKSVEIVFVSPRTKRSIVIPKPAVPGFTRVDSVKILGVTINRKFSVTQHVENLLAASAQTHFALRTLRHHGMPASAIKAVFQAIVIAKLSYASPAWWGFASKADRDRLESFLRRSVRLGYRDSTDTLSDICDRADDKLFENIISRGDRHLLYQLFPLEQSPHYSLRKRCHNFQLPYRTSALCDCNFVTRMLYKYINCSVQSSAKQ